MDEDLYPNDGQVFYPREPQDQVNARRSEKAKTLQGMAVLKDVVKRLETRIAFYESVDAMPDEVKADPVQFMNMHNANQMTRDNLKAEKEYIEQLIDSAR